MSHITVTYPPFTFKAAKHRGVTYVRASDVTEYLHLCAEATDEQGAPVAVGDAYRALARALTRNFYA